MQKPLNMLTFLSRLFRSMASRTISIQKVTLFLTAWFTTAYNIPFAVAVWASLGEMSLTLFMLFIAMILCLVLLSYLMVTIFTLKPIFKPCIVVLFFTSTILLYSNFSGKQYNPFAFNFNDWLAGIGRFFSLDFFAALLILSVMPSAILYMTKIDWGSNKKRMLRVSTSISVCVIVLVGLYKTAEQKVQPIYEATRSTLRHAIPMHFIDSNIKYIAQQYFKPVYPFSIVDAKPIKSRSVAHKTVVLIVSESVRADIFSAYIANKSTASAQTTAITSCNTYSNTSLQCMFSFLSSKLFNESQAAHQQNVLDILALAGVNIIWLSNQKTCGALCARAKVTQIQLLCDSSRCGDLELADKLLPNTLSEINPLQSNLIVIQTRNIASPLYSRFYPKEFSHKRPECSTLLVARCSNKQLVNSYNNAISYIATMVEHAVLALNKFQSDNLTIETALIFTAEYGESLGEGGYYFHGSPKAIAPIQQTRVPFMIVDSQLPHNCLASMQTTLNHDIISHTLLGQFHIQSKAYQLEHDIQAQCLNMGLIKKNAGRFKKTVRDRYVYEN